MTELSTMVELTGAELDAVNGGQAVGLVFERRGHGQRLGDDSFEADPLTTDRQTSHHRRPEIGPPASFSGLD